MNIKTNILFRIYFIGALCVVFGFAVLANVYNIQTDKQKNWKALSDSLTTSIFAIPAERGNIYSADDKLLATSVPYFELHIDFASKAMSNDLFAKSVDSLAFFMWQKFNLNSIQGYKQQLIKARNTRKRYFLLCSRADYSLLKEIKQWPLLRERRFKSGLIIETHQERTNPYGNLAKRTIGLIRQNAKDIGIEEAADSLLSGVKGKILKQKIAGGEWIPINSTGQIEPRNGYDIITTIDLGLQDITESTLMQAVTDYRAAFGCAVLMEVKTGAIKAIANLGRTADSSYSENYNYALALSNEPGSVFKAAAYLALFDDGYLKLTDSINSNHASADFGGTPLTDDGHNTQYTFLTPGKAFAISSNVAIAKWVTQRYNSNRQKFYDKISQFGLTRKTNIDLKGEALPTVYKPEKWSFTSLPWIAHGYEVKFTPLQILTFYNAIANNGLRVKPYIIQRVVDNGNIIREYKPSDNSGYRICKEEAAKMAKEIMLRVIEDPNGTARKIFSPHYRIAGKTGTAEMNSGSMGYSGANLSSFVGFFPADAPLYSCIVVIGGPQGLFTTGGAVSAPVFKTMADKIITSNIKSNVAINKDSMLANKPLPLVVSDKNAIGEIDKRFKIKFDFPQQYEYAFMQTLSSNKVGVGMLKEQEDRVPNVKGMLVDDAIYLLENKGLKVLFSGKGKVIGQSIVPGSESIKGSIIQLVLR